MACAPRKIQGRAAVIRAFLLNCKEAGDGSYTSDNFPAKSYALLHTSHVRIVHSDCVERVVPDENYDSHTWENPSSDGLLFRQVHMFLLSGRNRRSARGDGTAHSHCRASGRRVGLLD